MLDARTREILLSARESAAKRGIRAAIALHRERSHLMRIGNNSVSLNTSENLTRLDISVLSGRREGTHTHLGEIGSVEMVVKAIDLSAKKAEAACPRDYEPILPEVQEDIEESSQYDSALATLDPAEKAKIYAAVFAGAGQKYNFSGSWSSGVTELYLVSTANEKEAWHIGTDQIFSIVLKHPEAKWELQNEQTGWKAGVVTAEAAIEHLRGYLPIFEKNEGIRNEPGEYTVLFGASAISELLGMAVWTGCSGRMYEEKIGWTARNSIGDSVLGSNITVYDDPEDPLTFRMAFDMGGIRRRRFSLIDGGKLAGLFYDRATAAKYGKAPSGHETNSPGMVLACGSGPASPLEAAKKHGGRMLYIPALHYMNLPNMSKGIVTASSRFNATMVEDGKIIAPIFSSRVTDTFSNLFGRVAQISGTAVSVNGSNTYGRRAPVAMSVPAYVIAEGVKITDCAESF
jgi:predicted Zn-dependent protease